MVRRTARFASIRRFSIVVAAGAALSFADVARAQDAPPPPVPSGWRPRPVREGTVALYGAAMYGTVLGSGRYADAFDAGLGLGFAIRYRTGSESSLGLGFESHQFEGSSSADSAATPVELQFVMTTLDYYRHFSVRTRTPRYLVLGAGLMQSRQENLNGETEFPGDGGVVKLGGGFEYWVNRTLTLDVGLRYYGVLSESQWTHDMQAALGINFYTSP